MKTRNNSSKAFHNHETLMANGKSFQHLVDIIVSKIDSNKAQRLAISAFKEIIERCYNNRQEQQQLCKALNVPFFPGPVALNNLPNSFFQQQYLSEEDIQDNIMNQISYLFQYLKKTKQYFYCWIIYYNQQLKLLTVKMMKKYELKENIELLNSKYCMIGIFVDREVSLNVKKQGKFSFINNNKVTKQMQKTTAYSCYQNMSSPDIMKKPKNKQKKLNQLERNTYSLKSFNSASITNSSSFKNQSSQKQSEIQRQQNQISQTANIKTNQKMRNFKRKKEKLLLFADVKIRKSMSTKNQKSKSQLKMFKSLDKIQFLQKNHQVQNFKSQQKLHGARSISNADKFESYKKLDSNKIQFLKKKDFEFDKKEKKSNSLSKHRKLSKNSKVFSSYGSLNSSNQSQTVQIKSPDQKVVENFRRKISTNGTNFKKKKIENIKFESSSKKSFEFK